jgi:hypothetical protein
VTVAVLEIVPGAVTVTTIVIVTESPAGIFPRLHVTTPALWTHPGLALTNVTPLGSVSVTTTFVAASGPRLVTVIV